MKIIMGFLIVITSLGIDGGSREARQIRKSIQKLFGSETYTLSLLSPDMSATTTYKAEGTWYVISSNNTLLGYLYSGRVNTCRPGGCTNPGSAPTPEGSEYFLYYTIVDTAMVVRQVKIFDYRATHGYEITAGSWLKQFTGYRGHRTLVPGKNIDGISGATVSVTAITEELPLRYRELKRLLNTGQVTLPEQ